jgi:hypothetical protein
MPSFSEVLYGVFGAWRLALLDRGGMNYFDRSLSGFWKSFFAAALVAPAYLILVVLDLAESNSDAGVLRIFIVHLSAYTLSWVAFPLAVLHICEAIDKREAFVGYIVALNWAEVIQAVVLFPVLLLNAALGGAAAGFGLLTAVVYLLVLGYQWFVTKTALGIAGLGAAGLVALDLMIGVLINEIAAGMLT